MAALKPREKRFVVELLATFTSISDVVEAFAKEFPGRRVDNKQVWEYDLSKPSNRKERGADLVELFDATRKAYLEETSSVRIAHKGWRLRELEDLYLEEKRSKLRKSAKATLEQAAKESGGAYTNRHELTGKDGAPLPTPPAPTVVVDLSLLSREELTILEKAHGRLAPEPREHPEG